MHGNHDGGFDLVDDFHNVFETEIGHGIDGDHHNVDPLHYLFLLRSQKMADVSQVREAKAAHLIDRNRVGDSTPTLASLARYVDDRYVLHVGPDGIPSLPKGDAAQDNRVARNRSRVVVREMIVANCDRISLDARCDIEVWIGHYFGLTAGMNQKTRVSIPLDEIMSERR